MDRDAQPELPSRRFVRWLIVCWIVAQCLTIEAVAQTVERVKVKDESIEQEYRGEIQVEDDLGASWC